MTLSTSRPSTPAAAAAEAARFAEYQRQRKRNRWKLVAIGALVSVVLLAAGWVVCFSNVLAVKSVQVAGVKRLSIAQVERAAAVPHGGSLALLDTAPIEERVKALAPVADVHVERKFPNTVRIEVTERQPVAVLDTPTGRHLVDSEGVAYAPAGDDADKRFIVIETKQDTLPADAVMQVNAMVAALPEALRAKVKTVEANTEQDMTAVLTDGRKIVWGGPEDTEFKTKVLDVLLKNKDTRAARTFDVSVPEAPTVKR